MNCFCGLFIPIDYCLLQLDEGTARVLNDAHLFWLCFRDDDDYDVNDWNDGWNLINLFDNILIDIINVVVLVDWLAVESS